MLAYTMKGLITVIKSFGLSIISYAPNEDENDQKLIASGKQRWLHIEFLGT